MIINLNERANYMLYYYIYIITIKYRMENQDGNIDGYSRRMDKIDHKLEEIK